MLQRLRHMKWLPFAVAVLIGAIAGVAVVGLPLWSLLWLIYWAAV
jgi:hypothetical protein